MIACMHEKEKGINILNFSSRNTKIVCIFAFRISLKYRASLKELGYRLFMPKNKLSL